MRISQSRRLSRQSTSVVVALALILGQHCPESHAAVAIESISNRQVKACHIEQAGAYYALAEISEKTAIPIGFDAIQPSQEPTVILDFPGGTAADLLNVFVALVPGYGWQEASDGIIHVSRISAHVAVLDVMIAYPGADKKTRQEIWEQITKSPEVSAWMKVAECSRGELLTGGEFRAHNGKLSIAPGNRTLEPLLDEVTVKSGENTWAVLQWPGTAVPCRVAIMLW